jgi:transcriptional regulator with GAF, ATPase, and Fis domain
MARICDWQSIIDGMLRVPLRAGASTAGVLELSAGKTGLVTEGDLDVALRLAERVTVAIIGHRMAEVSRRSARHEERNAQLDGLLAILASATDVRDVVDRISEIGKSVLPHDGMTIVVPAETSGKLRVYATTGAMRGQPLHAEVDIPDPSLRSRNRDFDIIDDIQQHERYRLIPAARAGMHSMLTMLIWVGGAMQSSVNFLSATPGRFTLDDVPMGRRLASHIGLAMSQQRLAAEARQVQTLRNRTANLELLDELLTTLSDSGELTEVFDRISATARKVLPHQALFVAVFLADGIHARRYVSSGINASEIPHVVKLPESMRHPNWDYQIVPDLSVNPNDGALVMLKHGFHSAFRMSIRLEGQVVGVLTFMATELDSFKHDDLIVARRVADRVALSLSRERGVEAARRADEAIERAARLEARVRSLTEELDVRSGYRRVIGNSVPWRQILTQATQVAPTETTVLLLGESGTGKEVVARLLHRGSQRKDGPFVALNCAALPEQLLEAELFGYERGAFTGAVQSKPGQLEQASGGVLFLDEVGEMSLPAQAKFLRVLQEREFQRLGGTRILRTDTRIVAATNRDLQKAMANGQFREDLYYRLNVFAIRLPPLRDRRDDILALSQAFLAEFGRAFAHPPAGMSREAKQLLLSYHWPGNVRELRNILERAAILCDGGLITDEHLALPTLAAAPAARPAVAEGVAFAISPATAPPPPAPPAPSGERRSGDLQSIERAVIEQALQKARFNKSKAAKELGLTRHQLYVRMRRHGLAE